MRARLGAPRRSRWRMPSARHTSASAPTSPPPWKYRPGRLPPGSEAQVPPACPCCGEASWRDSSGSKALDRALAIFPKADPSESCTLLGHLPRVHHAIMVYRFVHIALWSLPAATWGQGDTLGVRIRQVSQAAGQWRDRVFFGTVVACPSVESPEQPDPDGDRSGDMHSPKRLPFSRRPRPSLGPRLSAK